MTATAQAMSQAVAEWSRIFPRQVTENLTSSVSFMKILSVVAVSTITYLKNAFPDDNYVCEQLSGMKIMLLKDKCNNDLAQFLSTALKQAFDAFEKKYLHQMVLCFYDGECKLDNLFEYHIFEYAYKDGVVSMSIGSKSHPMQAPLSCTLDNVRAQTAHMIRTCVVMLQTYPQPLPDSCDISLRLYYNQDTPHGYQAPGFQTAVECDDPLDAAHSGEAVKMGSVNTPFHTMTLRSYVKDSARDSHEAIPSQNPPMMTQAAEDLSCTTMNSESAESDSRGPHLRCACNNFHSDRDAAALLTCVYCKTQQHAACYGLLSESSARAAGHCCVTCAEQDPRRAPTDRKLAGVAAMKRESYAIFRRALYWCSGAVSVAASDLSVNFGLSQVSACKLMKLLDTMGVIRRNPNSEITTPSKIIPAKLKSVMSGYFHREEDLLDRLVAESLPSASQPDPVGDLLGPIEKVSLHNASQLGRVIDPVVNNNAQDPTLKQYRDALIVVERMDNMILSGDPIKDIKELEKRTGKRKTGKDVNMATGVKTKRAKTGY